MSNTVQRALLVGAFLFLVEPTVHAHKGHKTCAFIIYESTSPVQYPVPGGICSPVQRSRAQWNSGLLAKGGVEIPASVEGMLTALKHVEMRISCTVQGILMAQNTKSWSRAMIKVYFYVRGQAVIYKGSSGVHSIRTQIGIWTPLKLNSIQPKGARIIGNAWQLRWNEQALQHTAKACFCAVTKRATYANTNIFE